MGSYTVLDIIGTVTTIALYLALAVLILSGCATVPEPALLPDMTDSGVGCVDDCLDPLPVEQSTPVQTWRRNDV